MLCREQAPPQSCIATRRRICSATWSLLLGAVPQPGNPFLEKHSNITPEPRRCETSKYSPVQAIGDPQLRSVADNSSIRHENGSITADTNNLIACRLVTTPGCHAPNVVLVRLLSVLPVCEGFASGTSHIHTGGRVSWLCILFLSFFLLVHIIIISYTLFRARPLLCRAGVADYLRILPMMCRRLPPSLSLWDPLRQSNSSPNHHTTGSTHIYSPIEKSCSSAYTGSWCSPFVG